MLSNIIIKRRLINKWFNYWLELLKQYYIFFENNRCWNIHFWPEIYYQITPTKYRLINFLLTLSNQNLLLIEASKRFHRLILPSPQNFLINYIFQIVRIFYTFIVGFRTIEYFENLCLIEVLIKVKLINYF